MSQFLSDEEAWEVIRPMLNEGKTNREIVSHLNLNDYKRIDGGSWYGTDVSKIAIANGVRRKREFARTKKKDMVKTVKVETTEPTLANDVLDVMTSTLREPLKMRIVNLLTAVRT